VKKLESSYKKKIDTILDDYNTYKATYENTCKDGILVKIKKGSIGSVKVLGHDLKDIPEKDTQMTLKIPCK
jgi:hypothetical protein